MGTIKLHSHTFPLAKKIDHKDKGLLLHPVEQNYFIS